MKRIIQVTFEFKNDTDFRKVVAIYDGVEGEVKGTWRFYFKHGIRVSKYLKLDNYPLMADEVTFDKARTLAIVHGFLTDKSAPENGY